MCPGGVSGVNFAALFPISLSVPLLLDSRRCAKELLVVAQWLIRPRESGTINRLHTDTTRKHPDIGREDNQGKKKRADRVEDNAGETEHDSHQSFSHRSGQKCETPCEANGRRRRRRAVFRAEGFLSNAPSPWS